MKTSAWELPIRKAVVDSCPLFSALTLHYVRQSPPSRRDSILNINEVPTYLRSEPVQRNFLRLFDGIQTLLTTSHVIGEIQGLQKLKQASGEEFWQSSILFLKARKLDERLVKLLDLDRKGRSLLVGQIGPTDTGLIELAIQTKSVVLTDDGRTLARARPEAVDVRLVEHLVRSS